MSICRQNDYHVAVLTILAPYNDLCQCLDTHDNSSSIYNKQ